MTSMKTFVGLSLLSLGFALQATPARAESDRAVLLMAHSMDSFLDDQVRAAQRLPRVDAAKRSLGQRMTIAAARAAGGVVGGASHALLGGTMMLGGSLADTMEVSFKETQKVDVAVQIAGKEHQGSAKIEQRRNGGLVTTALVAAAGAGATLLGFGPEHWPLILQPAVHFASTHATALTDSAPMLGAASAVTYWVGGKAALHSALGVGMGGYKGAKAGATAAGRKVAQVLQRPSR